MRFCPNCQKNVSTEPLGSMAVMALLTLLTVLSLLTIVLYPVMFVVDLVYLTRGRRCPTCHTPEKRMHSPQLNQ